MQESSFAEKFIKRIKRIDSGQIESFLSQVLREREFLHVILDSIPEGVIVVDQGEKVAYCNEAGRQYATLTRAKGAAHSLRKVLKDREMITIAEEFASEGVAIRGREVFIGNPVERVYTVSIIPIENENDLATHSVWIIGDRTEVHRLIEERQRMSHLESLATLTAGVAHEIKNPLNSLQIHGQLIQRNIRKMAERYPSAEECERIEGSTEVILEEIQRVANIVDEFTSAVRPVRLNRRRVRIEEVLAPILELLEPECLEKGITVHKRYDPDVPPLNVDTEQLQQALLNLMKNAIEAMDKAEPRLSIRTRLQSDHVLIEIEDNGSGIPDSIRDRIFEPHFTTKFTGSGLGLMMVLRVLRAHRGAIALSSQEGIGTKVSVALPLDGRPTRMLQTETPMLLTSEGGEGEGGTFSPEIGTKRPKSAKKR